MPEAGRSVSDGPLTTGDIVARFDGCRTGVMKHLSVLAEANLVIVRREGRVRWNHHNPVPIQAVCDRRVARHVRRMASAMNRLKALVERDDAKEKEEDDDDE